MDPVRSGEVVQSVYNVHGQYQQNSIQSGDKIWLKRHVVQSVILWNLPSHEVNLEPTFGDRDRAWIWQGVGSNFQTLSNTKHFHKTQNTRHGFDKESGQTFKHKTLQVSEFVFHESSAVLHGFGREWGQTFKQKTLSKLHVSEFTCHEKSRGPPGEPG